MTARRSRRVAWLLWRERVRQAAVPVLLFAGMALVLLAVLSDTYRSRPSESATLLSERVVLDEYGNHGLWMVQLGGEVRSLRPHPDIRFTTGKTVCVQRSRGAWLGVEKARILHDGACD